MITKGPWEYAPEGDETAVAIPVAGGYQAFSVLGNNSETAIAEDYANARAIAAVPELLAALEGFLTTGYYPETRAAAKAALTKARGA